MSSRFALIYVVLEVIMGLNMSYRSQYDYYSVAAL